MKIQGAILTHLTMQIFQRHRAPHMKTPLVYDHVMVPLWWGKTICLEPPTINFSPSINSDHNVLYSRSDSPPVCLTKAY